MGFAGIFIRVSTDYHRAIVLTMPRLTASTGSCPTCGSFLLPLAGLASLALLAG